MASTIPSLEDMGVKEWFPEGDKTPTGMKVLHHAKTGPEGRKQIAENRRKEILNFNGIFFLILAAPTYLALAFGAPADYFNKVIYSIPHEAGAAIACLLNSSGKCGSGGTLAELILSIIAAYYSFRNKDNYVTGLCFVMSAGFSLQRAYHEGSGEAVIGSAVAMLSLLASTALMLSLYLRSNTKTT
jgi:hypothetical protein